MHGTDYRDNPINWSLQLGRISGIRVRLHLLFLVWIAFELLRDAGRGTLAAGVVISALLFIVVLLHELGHCFGARAVGGDANEILLWPLGGLATVSAPMKPGPQLVTTAAGPLVNLVFCMLTAALLVLLGQPQLIQWNPLALAVPAGSPFSAWGLGGWLATLWVVNYLLLLFNLLPTFPMDGGRLLQGTLWYRQGYRRATLNATFVGMVGAVVFGLVGLATETILLVFIAVFGYLTCMRERMLIKSGMLEADPGFGGFSEFDVQQDRPARMSWLGRRRARRIAAQAERERQREAALEDQIDAILQKVHDHGMHSLTAREKKILEAGTARRRQP